MCSSVAAQLFRKSWKGKSPVTAGVPSNEEELSRQIAECKRAREELAERVSLSKLTEEIGRVLTQNAELRKALQVCAEAIVQNLETAFARIWILDETGELLHLQASAGMYTRIDGEYACVRVGDLKVGRIAKKRQPALSNDIQNDPEVDNRDWAKREGIVGFAGHPLIVEGTLLGVVAVFARHPFSQLTLKALGWNAEAMALGIKRSKAEEALHALAARLDSLREEERMRLSREIHDQLGQKLTALKMDLSWVERKLSQPGKPAEVNGVLDRIIAVIELADEILATVQEIAAELRPGVLDKLGLGAALQYEAGRFSQRTGIPFEVHLPEPELKLSTELSTTLFRIFQECLTNIARHAQASKVVVELKVEEGVVTLRVEDNGRGITDADMAKSKSLGLLGMKERAMLLGGELQIQNRPEGGTIVTVRILQPSISFPAKDTP
jgi:signal transduction histidine kinase